ncbi:MAG: DUF1800 domain-containing protein [Panacagrimonas sp.]
MSSGSMSRWAAVRVGVALLTGWVVWTTPAQALITPEEIDAARLLTQATFGPTREEIDRAVGLGTVAWVDEQLRLPASLHLPLYRERSTTGNKRSQRHYVWWERSVKAPDQLRQRVAFALSEILVVSEKSDIDQDGLAHYYDVLVSHAFGNFRTLLEQVTLSPAMGRYLSMQGNQKPDPAAGIRADENFAREVMQLFSIGLIKLRIDGSPMGGATYTQADVENLARIFTGWNWAGMPKFNSNRPNWLRSMQAYPKSHDTGAKRFLNQTFEAGRSAEEELGRALDILFQHPNVGPFLARQLIQRMVTSNPTKAYIQRVASVFNDNGSGVRGDLGAVVRAVLLDTEARNGHNGANRDVSLRQYGKLREPVVRIAHVWRAFHAQGVGRRGIFPVDNSDPAAAQGPLTSPSVFNFFSPDYSPPGELGLAALGYRVPEMQIVDESLLASTDNFMAHNILTQFVGNPSANQDAVLIDLSYEKTLAADIPALLEHLGRMLLNGPMGNNQAAILTRRLQDFVPGSAPGWDAARVAEAIYLIVESPQYLVQR